MPCLLELRTHLEVWKLFFTSHFGAASSVEKKNLFNFLLFHLLLEELPKLLFPNWTYLVCNQKTLFCPLFASLPLCCFGQLEQQRKRRNWEEKTELFFSLLSPQSN